SAATSASTRRISSRHPRTSPPDRQRAVVDSAAAMVDLDTRLLRAFVVVAEELNFTRAAERLHLAQQALSAQIRQLESRLDVRLFERTTRKVGLTEAGELLLPHAVAVLANLDAGVASLQAASRAKRATLRVGLSGTSTVPLVSETMRVFAEHHP